LKELSFQVEEDRKSKNGLQEMIEKLNNKIKVLKRQIDEAEEIAAVNLGKYRKVQNELDDAAERADQAENQLCKQRLRYRSTMSVGRGGSQDVRISFFYVT
jgi:myosin heavy chain 6/7